MSTTAVDLFALRTQIANLRQEVENASRSYSIAKEQGRSVEASALLRQRSALIEQLFQRQSELMLAWRLETIA